MTIARAVQLLDSKDEVVRLTARSQLALTISRGLDLPPDGSLPLSEFLSGSTEGGLYNTRFYKCGPNSWTRTRKVVTRLHVRIDVSSNNFLSKVINDDISCISVKAVRGLRTVIRRRWTTELAKASNQGRVTKGLLLDSSSDIARLTSSRAQLSSLYLAHLVYLPLTAGAEGVRRAQRPRRMSPATVQSTYRKLRVAMTQF